MSQKRHAYAYCTARALSQKRQAYAYCTARALSQKRQAYPYYQKGKKKQTYRFVEPDESDVVVKSLFLKV